MSAVRGVQLAGVHVVGQLVHAEVRERAVAIEDDVLGGKVMGETVVSS
jgi:hypothetical protein